MNKKRFKRIERKFALTYDQAKYLKTLFPKQVVRDKYSDHFISSLYFDTNDHHFLKEITTEKSYREKFRIRKYGDPQDISPIYLEIKRKFQGMTDKRRIKVAHHELDDMLENIELAETTFSNLEEEYIFNEIQWLFRRLALEPKVYIYYLREAFVNRDSEDLRITFDQNIHYRLMNLTTWEHCTEDNLVAPEIDVLMEVKTTGEIPEWLQVGLDRMGKKEIKFSKYKQVYKRYIQEDPLYVQ
ncbi:VTC domain-containing protein [Enterococcus faecium]|uniref:VTC domain-containing protein n=1 Tax=Enterococcus faecium TaxID=1352 RepID=UPI0039E77CDA